MKNDVTLVDANLFPKLVVKAGGRSIEEIDLRTDLTIGRAEDNKLTLADPKVSRHHALIKRGGAAFVLTDLDSANGTRVNGVRLTAPHTLRHGERIAIGDTELTYQEPGQALQDTISSPVPPAVVRAAGSGMAGPSFLRERRGLFIGLIAIAALAIVVVAALLLFNPKSGLLARATPTPEATASAVAEPTTAETPGEVSPVPTQASTAEPSSPSGGDVDGLLAQAEALARRSKFEDALTIYEDLSSRVPDDVRVEIGWAWALLLDDMPGEALPHAQRAVELEPDNGQAAAVLSRALAENGDTDQAIAFGEKAVDLASGDALAHAALAEAYLADGQTQEAADEADLALVQDINSAAAHRVRGWVYQIADNDIGRAASELQIAAGLEPELWLRRHELGALLLQGEDYTTAILAFQDALGIRAKAVTYTLIGEAYYHLGQFDQARASLQQAVSAGADDVHTQALLAATYAQLDRCEDAQDYYEQVLEEEPENPLALEAQETCEEGGPSSAAPTSEATSAGATPTVVATRRASQPAASLSGRIAFPVWDTQKGKYDTYVAQAKDGAGRALVVAEMHQPAFNPDGTWLLVNGEGDERMNLFLVQPDGGGLREATKNIEDGLPAWSSDGSQVAFSSTKHGDRQSRVYIIDQVPFKGSKVEGRPLNFGPDDIRGEFPAWVADGRVVYKGCDVTVEPAPCGLFIMSSIPGPQPFTQLTENGEDTAPAVHGDTVAFTSNRDGNWEIYAVGVDGTGLERLTNNPAIDGLPTWSPDGKSIAFVSNEGGAWGIWAMNADGSNRRKLFDVGGSGLASDWQHERISWAP